MAQRILGDQGDKSSARIMTNMEKKKYKIKGLDCWQKAKELRQNEYRDLAKAKEEGKIVVSTKLRFSVALLAGIGDHIVFAGGPYGASVSTDNEFSQQCLRACEARGFAPDMCAYMRNYLGSMYLNRYFFGGEFPKPDFLFFAHDCDSIAKWWQVVAEHYKLDYFGIDLPTPVYSSNIGNMVEYLVVQMHEAIEWLEKVTKRKYDDEKFIEAVDNELKVGKYAAESFVLNQTIPAPLDIKSMFSFIPLSIHLKHKKEGVEFFKMLRGEMKERVDNQIAALATERFRLLNITGPPWFFLRLYRYMEKFGCALVGGHYPFSSIGGWGFKLLPDGTYTVAEIPEDRGEELKTRDDAVRALAMCHLNSPFTQAAGLSWMKPVEQIRMIKQWKGDGMILHMDRACEFMSAGNTEVKLALQKERIPVLVFEGNRSDCRDFNEAGVTNSVDAFMESQGLKIIPD